MTATTSASGYEARIQDYMNRPYVMEVLWEEDCWAARFPELPGLTAVSETWDGLEQKIADAKWSYFETALEADLPIPEPGEPGEPI
jgi:predicted RNase H-like HicB family nuclease